VAVSRARFQKQKYVSQIAAVRRELSGWVSTYRTMLLPENVEQYTVPQLSVAIRRESWLEEIAERLEEIEIDLADGDE
jgi:hypothetical protein